VQKNKQLLIWDSESLPTDSNDYVILWQSYTILDLNKEISIPQLVENNADDLRSRYLAFIYDLGELRVGKKRIVDYLEIRPNFSYWWMTLLVEKCNYSKSPQIDNIIKLMVFDDYLDQKHFTAIKIVTANKQLAEAVQILTDSYGVPFEWVKLSRQKPIKNIIRTLYSYLPHVFKVIVYLPYYLVDRWKLKGVGFENLNTVVSNVTFVSYFFNLDSEAANKGIFKDKYWTELPYILSQAKVASNWLHIYIKSQYLPTTESAKRLIQKYNKSHQGIQNHLFIDSFLSFQVVRQSISDWIKVLSKYSKIREATKEKASYFWPLVKPDLKESLIGVTAIKNLLFYNLFRSAMQMLRTQKKGFYLQENQGWEMGFVGAWREFSHGQLIGVPHSTVRYWDLRYFWDKRLYNKSCMNDLPLPDMVGVNGENAKNAYISGKYPENSLLNLEALRYLSLKKYTVNSEKSSNSNNNVVLILGDSEHKNTEYIMTMLENSCMFIDKKTQFLVKPHPLCESKKLFFPKVKFELTNISIFDLFEKVSLVIATDVTSAAVEAYYAGKKVLTILNPNKLNLLPLRGCDGQLFVSTSEELVYLINRFNQHEAEKNQVKDYFFLDSNLPMWRELLIDSGSIEKKTDLKILK